MGEIINETEKFDVRDLREKGKFVVDDVFLNGYAKFLGVYAVGVYCSFCRHVNKEQKCWPSIEKIAEELGCGKTSIIEAIKKLEFWNIIKKIRIGKTANNRYVLLSKNKWKDISEVCLADFSEVCHTDLTGLLRKLHTSATRTSKKGNTVKETHRRTAEQKSPPIPVQELVDYFEKKFIEEVSDNKPIINFPKVVKLSTPYLKDLGLERMKELVDKYFATDNKFYREVGWGIDIFLTSNVIHSLNNK